MSARQIFDDWLFAVWGEYLIRGAELLVLTLVWRALSPFFGISPAPASPLQGLIAFVSLSMSVAIEVRKYSFASGPYL